MELTEIVKKCVTLKDVFQKAQVENMKILSMPLKTGRKGFSVISAKEDYALIEVKGDSFDESVRALKGIHPYGSSIVYQM